MNSTSPYKSISRQFEQLDLRNHHYRFDLERDFDWASTPKREHIHFPKGMMEHFGVNTSVFDTHPELLAPFDWGSALGICAVFAFFEQKVVDFAEGASGFFSEIKSVGWLAEEERKHIALFDRYRERLRLHRPEWQAMGDRAVAAQLARMDRHHSMDPMGGPSSHYDFWSATVFFEELTIIADDYFRRFEGEVDPLWLRVHALHRREETQHVITDEACLASLSVPAEETYRLSQRFVLSAVLTDYWDMAGLSVGAAVVAELFPGAPNPLPSGKVTQRPAFRDYLNSPRYRRSRNALPYLAELATLT